MKNSELLNTQRGVEEGQNKENYTKQLVETYKSKEGVLMVVGNKEKGYAVALGEHRISDWYEEPNEAMALIEDRSWELIFNVAGIIANDIVESSKRKEETEKRQ